MSQNDGALLSFKSHIGGKNADVAIFPPRHTPRHVPFDPVGERLLRGS